MQSFQAALALVHESLLSMHARGKILRTSLRSLEDLAAVPLPQAVTGVESRPAAINPPSIVKTPPSEMKGASAASASAASDLGVSSPRATALATFRDPVLACLKCPALAASRTQVVFGVGNPDAELMFVGEAPGEDEDRLGEPFVGRAGQLLTRIIEAMGYLRSEVYIANVLKCRPNVPPGASGNRRPIPEEMKTCLPYLREQIQIIQPKVLVALGAVAMEGLMGATNPMAALRGRWHQFQSIPLMATYHPAYLLRNQSLGEKRKVWEDMMAVLERLGRPISAKQRAYFLQPA